MAELLERDAVRVGGVEISADWIADKIQSHPAEDSAGAWQAAARALAVRELLLGEARRNGVLAGEFHDEHSCEQSAKPRNFAAIAKANSACPLREQGGNLGQIGPGETAAEFEEALFALKEGEMVADPVCTRYGVHMWRSGTKVVAQQLPFEAVYALIRAAETGVEGIELPVSEGPLVQ